MKLKTNISASPLIVFIALAIFGASCNKTSDANLDGPYTITAKGELYKLSTIVFETNAPASKDLVINFGDGTSDLMWGRAVKARAYNYVGPFHVTIYNIKDPKKILGSTDITIKYAGQAPQVALKDTTLRFYRRYDSVVGSMNFVDTATEYMAIKAIDTFTVVFNNDTFYLNNVYNTTNYYNFNLNNGTDRKQGSLTFSDYYKDWSSISMNVSYQTFRQSSTITRTYYLVN